MGNPVLLIIDVQEAWRDARLGRRNNPDAETRIGRLLGFWHQRAWPVVSVQHASRDPASLLAPNQPGYALSSALTLSDGDYRVTKTTNSAFVGTDLQSWLEERHHRELVVVGLTTVHCCSTTIRMGANLGFQMYAVDDAMATFDMCDVHGQTISAAEMHRMELAALSGEFATVVRTEDIWSGAWMA